MIELAGAQDEAGGAICFIMLQNALLPKLIFPVTGAEDEGGGADEEERGGERKARRGEIDPTHEFTFHLIGQVMMMIYIL